MKNGNPFLHPWPQYYLMNLRHLHDMKTDNIDILCLDITSFTILLTKL